MYGDELYFYGLLLNNTKSNLDQYSCIFISLSRYLIRYGLNKKAKASALVRIAQLVGARPSLREATTTNKLTVLQC